MIIILVTYGRPVGHFFNFSNTVWGKGHVNTPGYFNVKVSDGKYVLFNIKLDDLSEKKP